MGRSETGLGGVAFRFEGGARSGGPVQRFVGCELSMASSLQGGVRPAYVGAGGECAVSAGVFRGCCARRFLSGGKARSALICMVSDPHGCS